MMISVAGGAPGEQLQRIGTMTHDGYTVTASGEPNISSPK
jgi:hypothetical protein